MSISRLRPSAALLAVSFTLILAGATLLAVASPVLAGRSDADDPVVEILPVEGYLDPAVVGAIEDLVRDANERGSHLVVIQIDSPGSLSADVRALLDTVRGSAVPVAVFVGPGRTDARAGGAAGMLLAASHVRAMAPDARVGPLAPADLGNAADDPDDPSRLAPGLIEDPAVLAAVRETSVEAPRAEELGLADVLAVGLEPLLVELDGRAVETGAGTTTLRLERDRVITRLHSLGLLARVQHAATTPAFVYLLLVGGLGMLLFEAFQPGFGVAGVAGLAVLPLAVVGLSVLPVAWWALGLLVLGLVLYGIDAAVAGFGALTAAATASFAAGSWWLYDSPNVPLSGWVVAATTVTALVFFVVVLTVVLRAQAPPDESAIEDLVGRVGMVRSVLNPEGHVYVDDALWRARWTGEGKRAKVGTPIRVHGVDGPVVLVDEFDPAGADGDEEPAPTGANPDGTSS